MTDALSPSAVPRNSPWRVWPLLAAAVAISAGVSIGPQLSTVPPDGPLHTLLALVGGLLLLGGAVVHLRTPDAPPGPPFIGLASAAAVLSALQTIDPSVTPTTPVGLFLLVGPWRYLLIPAAVHFALTVAWSHQGRVWLGVITGWYALHLALFIATAGGLLFGEAPLLRVVDGFFLRQILEPVGATIAVGALLLALASRNRRQSQRRAVLIALATLLLGLVPVILFSLVPEARMLIGLPPTLAMASLPVLVIGGVSTISALPMVNPEKRDLIAHRTAQRLLEEADLAAGLRDVAERLAEIFEAEGVVIRIGVPAVEVTAGTPRRARPEGLFTPDPETFEERRAVVVPIGRGADPLGEAYLEGRFPGAFGRREREWLLAFLGPISSAIRVRRREAERVGQLAAFATDAASVSRDLAHAVGLIPELTSDEGRRVPLPVDASEVLGQLAAGSLSIREESEALERAADEARGHARAATDAIARAMDGMARLGNELAALERHGDAIAAGNQTVNGVAFRTNLLANTAALEASRAGAAGRTFAVLAEEIRRLADATAEATATIESERAAMTRDAAEWHAQLEALRGALTEAVREAEASEETVRRIAGLAGTVESAARALGPPIEEANAVARRRSARDAHLTATFEELVSERSRLAAALASHRDATDRLGEQLERLARAGRGRGRAAPR